MVLILKTMQLLAVSSVIIALASTLGGGAAAHDQVLPGCQSTCGNVPVPYPFGIGVSNVSGGKNCFFQDSLNLTCTNQTLYTGNVQILNITLEGQLDMLFFVANVCKDGYERKITSGIIFTLKTPAFAISRSQNKFVSVGCDTYGYLNSYFNGKKFSTGCLTRCNSYAEMQAIPNDGNCTGIGCCQVDIPPQMKNISLQASSFNNFDESWEFNNCSYSFVVKNGNYSFSLDHLKKGLPFKKAPIVVDWSVGNKTCEKSKGKANYACKGNSDCENSATGYGYRCVCKKGYDGNPYHPDGCQDIEECKIGKHNCSSVAICLDERKGSFECKCPDGQEGDGTEKGTGCKQKQRDKVLSKIAIGAASVAVVVLSSWLYLIHRKRKFIKLKEKFFALNGGKILEGRNSRSTKMFTAEQLEKATKNYDESLIIGKGGFGTVYKGSFPDNQVVAIKKSKVVDQSQMVQFINEVVVLSEINHRNVVKLLGCCLETQVPILVYELFNNGTLFDYLHGNNNVKKNKVSWKERLRIAAEVAEALSYLHSGASVPIIHRDVKSANVLLDDNHTAKVSDFGTSRLAPLDQTEFGAILQGTLGYIDPESMQTNQLTVKSDVYSFGVVLVELLTGEKALFHSNGEKISLVWYFLSLMREGRVSDVIQAELWNEENKEEIKEVAILATKCLRFRGDERPSMKEVARKLEGIRSMEDNYTDHQNLEESQYLLLEAPSIHEIGDGSFQQSTGYDSLRDVAQKAIDDGR